MLVKFLQARGGALFFGGPELFGGGTMEKWQPESLLMRREREKTWAWICCGWIHGKYMRFLGLNGPDPFDLINGSDPTAFKLIRWL